ncbi:hypothetical protein GCM10009848_66540 [Micromonospora lupini]
MTLSPRPAKPPERNSVTRAAAASGAPGTTGAVPLDAVPLDVGAIGGVAVAGGGVPVVDGWFAGVPARSVLVQPARRAARSAIVTPVVEAGLMSVGRVVAGVGSLVKALIRSASLNVWERSKPSLFLNTWLYLHA